MGVELSWYNDEETILLFRFQSPWKWDEFFAADTESDRLVADKNYLVDTIFDFTEASTVPRQALSNFIHAARRSGDNPHHGTTVVFGFGRFARVMTDMVKNLIQSEHIQFANDMEHALEIIAQLKTQRAHDQSKKV